jgi:hypothetical protein
MKFRHLSWLLVSLVTLSFPARAESVLCHVTYGGETRSIEAQPVASPYGVAPVAIGSYFLFRIVFQMEPADLASIKLYTYADRDEGPVIIHQATFPYPVRHAAVYGFTGQQWVYEPLRDGEMQYWCELKTLGTAK